MKKDNFLIGESCGNLIFPKTPSSQFDILIDENKENIEYDLIITDAFLTRFDDANKKSILGFWKNSISKNGIIVTTIRIDEANPFVQISKKYQ